MTLKTLLKKFEAAVRADEMVGSCHPLERHAIQLNYKRHRRAMHLALARLNIRTAEVVPPKPVEERWTPEEIEQFNEERG